MDDRTDAQLDSSLIPQPPSLPTRRFRPYPEYKDSGVEWLSEIPAYWRILPFKRLFSIIYRYPTYYGIEYVPEGVPEIRGEALSENGDIIELDDQRYITAELSQQYPHTILTLGDLVMSVRGTMGKVGLVDKRFENANITANLLRLSPRAQVALGKFLVFAFSSIYFRQQLDSQSHRTTIKTITVPQLSSIPVVIPPKEDQIGIIEFIVNETSKIDALVAKKERLIQVLQEKRNALITHAVTRGLDPDVPMKDSGVEWLGKIPAHWEVKKLKRIAEISYGIVLELDRTLTEGTTIISLPNVSIDGELNLQDVPFTPLRQDEREYLLLKKGDLLFNWRNGSSDHVGKTALFDAQGDYTHVSFLLRVRFSGGGFIPRFYQRYLNSLRFTGFFMATKAGVNNTFNQSELMELEVLLPPANEQLLIATFLDQEMAKLDTLIAKIREAIARLKVFRTALISTAVTGKIDVREEVV